MSKYRGDLDLGRCTFWARSKENRCTMTTSGKKRVSPIEKLEVDNKRATCSQIIHHVHHPKTDLNTKKCPKNSNSNTYSVNHPPTRPRSTTRWDFSLDS